MQHLVKIVFAPFVILIAFVMGITAANLHSRQFESISEEFKVRPIVWWGLGIGNFVLAPVVMGAFVYGAARSRSEANVTIMKVVMLAWPVVAFGQVVGLLLGVLSLSHPLAVVASVACYVSGSIGGIVTMWRCPEYW